MARHRFSTASRSASARRSARRVVRVVVALLSAAVLVVCGAVWLARAEADPAPPLAPSSPSEAADDGP